VAPTISADGRFLAYLETRCPEPPASGGCVSLQVAEVGSARPVEVITGAERLERPRWTHDGLGLVIGGALGAGRSGLFAIPRLGGSPRRLADEPLAYAVHPSADSLALVVAGDSGAALQVVDLASGQAIGRAVALPLAPLDIDWSPDGRRFALSGYDQLHVVRRDGVPLSSLGRTGTRAPLRWSADGRHLLTFRWSAGQDDDLMAYPVADDGRLGAPRLLISQMPTLLRGEFDVAREAGRLVVGSGAEFSDVWLFDLEPASLRSRRLTQGTSWYGSPVLTSDGRSVYYLRADPLGNSLYSNVDGRETALTAERQVVNSSLRLSPDERAVVFESSVDTSLVLMIHDIATRASRRVPRTTQAMGWLLPGGREIAWADHSTRSVWLTDAEGGNRREVSVRLADDAADGNHGWSALPGRWLLAPDGESLAILLTGRGEAQLVEVPLHGGQPTRLGRFMLSDGDIGLSAWSRTGMIYLARRHPDAGGTVLLQLDPATGDVRPHAEMDRPCAPLSVSYAPAARRGACTVNEVRADLMLIDGLRP
jgi:dipeptidyl aminopeptidase/acylaminoacyl peptidase